MSFDPLPIQPVEDAGVLSWTMKSTSPSAPGFQFGVFEVDAKTGELQKEGRLVHLRNQPFQVLTALLDRAGDLVTREEIKAAIWADDVDVDVEQGLNYCHKEIRSALGDNADSPRFIQTLPRRGYRFLGEVRRRRAIPPTPEPGPVGIQDSGVAMPPRSEAPPTEAAHQGPGRWHSALVGVLVIALVATILTWRTSITPRSPEPGSGRERVVVLPFADLSARPEGYLADGLTDELIGSLGRITQGRLSVIARSTSLAYRLREQDAAAFARELGASYFIEGTVRRDQRAARVSVTLARASDGTQLWSETYDRSIGDLLLLEGEVAAAITTAMARVSTSESWLSALGTRAGPMIATAHADNNWCMLPFPGEARQHHAAHRRL
jgi:TolB-like protein/DNA-binding winged helix-turn-helix (wHTH) protein